MCPDTHESLVNANSMSLKQKETRNNGSRKNRQSCDELKLKRESSRALRFNYSSADGNRHVQSQPSTRCEEGILKTKLRRIQPSFNKLYMKSSVRTVDE